MSDDGARDSDIIKLLLHQSKRLRRNMSDRCKQSQQRDGLVDEVLIQMRLKPHPIQQIVERLEPRLLPENPISITRFLQRLEVGEGDGCI